MTEFSSNLTFDKQETVRLAHRVSGSAASASDGLEHALRASSVDLLVEARSSSGGSLELTAEDSDDGDSWSEIEAIDTLTRTGSASLTVTPTKEWLRVAWEGGAGWSIDVTATGHATIEAGNVSASGGSQPVGCVLARDAPFDIHDTGSYNVEWDALYDNFWDLNSLAAIPAGLGLTFAFDGSSSLVVPTEAGIWTLSYLAERVTDDQWVGSFSVGGVGAHFPWVQDRQVGVAQGTPYMSGTLATPLPAGTQMTHQIQTVTEATPGPYTCHQVYLSIVRHA